MKSTSGSFPHARGSVGVPGRLASPQQWSALATRHAAVIARSKAAASIPFAYTGVDAATLRAQARSLGSLPNTSAAIASRGDI